LVFRQTVSRPAFKKAPHKGGYCGVASRLDGNIPSGGFAFFGMMFIPQKHSTTRTGEGKEEGIFLSMSSENSKEIKKSKFCYITNSYH
jgi:hypothetical protein